MPAKVKSKQTAPKAPVYQEAIVPAEENARGAIRIASGAIATIVRRAACSVEGVTRITGNSLVDSILSAAKKSRTARYRFPSGNRQLLWNFRSMCLTGFRCRRWHRLCSRPWQNRSNPSPDFRSARSMSSSGKWKTFPKRKRKNNRTTEGV